jgi:hypothetical protein
MPIHPSALRLDAFICPGAVRGPMKKMTQLPHSAIAALEYKELLQTCHELLNLALAANALSRRDARWYRSQLLAAWDDTWQTWDEFLADAADYYV